MRMLPQAADVPHKHVPPPFLGRCPSSLKAALGPRCDSTLFPPTGTAGGNPSASNTRTVQHSQTRNIGHKALLQASASVCFPSPVPRRDADQLAGRPLRATSTLALLGPGVENASNVTAPPDLSRTGRVFKHSSHLPSYVLYSSHRCVLQDATNSVVYHTLATASDPAGNDDAVAVQANMDEPSSELALPEDGENDEQAGETGNDKQPLAEDEGQVVSNVQLKTVSPHNGDKKSARSPPGTSPGTTGTSTPAADEAHATGSKGTGGAVKASSAVDEEKEAREREKYKQIYGQAAKEAAETARAQQQVPKSQQYHRLVGRTTQQEDYEKLKKELEEMPADQREKLIAKRRKEVQDRKDARKKYDQVIEELKKKLKEREQRKAAAAKQPRTRSKTI
ncbi:unnamed protein product [Rangifer tarandus platyrhynchus]|uniref:Uncharacterized protein n=1 Tax=Rangifer tarandus platyrhynchus TaxID=3082113 RepID=A0ABN8XIM1_RANTA|nr:unnamed protein product [Rangifer tarandus platyrhynchus]